MKNLITILCLCSFLFSDIIEVITKNPDDRGNFIIIEYFKKDSFKKKLIHLQDEIYYRNGSLRLEKNYKDGELDGKYILYYKNGQIYEERNYKDGKEDGKYTWYYEDGQIREEGNYKDGKKDGKWTYYYENGQISSERNYKDGRLIK
jgi:antitoxin component YwqK of YwqJK toxin-antitoxin module